MTLIHNNVPTFLDFRQQSIDMLMQDVDSIFNELTLSSPLKDACHYAMLGGGKRVRPLFVASSYITNVIDTSVNQNIEVNVSDMARRAMLAVEFLHAYSLIHDDLPCMDDDDLRRGRATCHIAFDEATALLAGDALQTMAFEILTADIKGLSCDMSMAANLLQVFAPRARRMVSGQMLDLAGENKQLTQTELQGIHQDKTGALIEAAVLMGAVCAKAESQKINALSQFAKNIGLAFQVQDDILDVTADTQQLGKPSGSDEKLDKSTYVKLMGVDVAKDYASKLFLEAKDSVCKQYGENNRLIEMADWLWTRKK